MRRFHAGMAVAVGLLAASAACAQAPGAPAASPEVKALVGQVAAAYKSLNSFGATIETTSGSG